MKTIAACIWVVLCLVGTAVGETHYVDSETGDDSREETTVSMPWRTIGKCASTMVAGDTCLVASGIYEESVTPSNSGDDGSFITYAAQPGAAPVVRNFTLNGNDYIRIIGFTIAHNSLAYNHGIALYNSDYCQILNNYVHHIRGQGVRNNTYYENSNYNVIRGNRFDYLGCPATGSTADCTGANGIKLNGGYNLIEYNELSHTLDFFDLNGPYNVIRNNYVHDFKNADFPNGSGDRAHVDFWQPFSLEDNNTNHCVVEYNFAVDVWERNSHFLQVRDESLRGISELIIRGNVGARFGSYVAQFGAVQFSRLYNNTFSDFDYNQTKGWTTVSYTVEPPSGGQGAVNNHNFNNIFYRTNRPNGYIIYTAPASSVTAEYNGCIETGSHESCRVSSGITFLDYADDDYQPTSSSQARGNGRPMTTVVSASDTGVSFQVADAGFFIGGWDVYDATGGRINDTIKIGSGNPARITGIDYASNTITVASTVSWSVGDPVVLFYQDISPTLGAYEYQVSNDFDITIGEPAAQSLSVVRLSADSSNPTSIRYVEFFVDGLPVGATRSYPYSVDWTAGEASRTIAIEVKAYSMFASKTPIKTASISYTHNGGDIRPNSPTNLRIVQGSLERSLY